MLTTLVQWYSFEMYSLKSALVSREFQNVILDEHHDFHKLVYKNVCNKSNDVSIEFSQFTNDKHSAVNGFMCAHFDLHNLKTKV